MNFEEWLPCGIIHGCEKKGATDETRHEATEAAYEKGWVLGKIGLAQAKAGDRSGAEVTFQQAVQVAATSGKDSDKARILAIIAIDRAEVEQLTTTEGKPTKTTK
ncbi:MAG: hypothetical protein FJ249_03940 [Nitrospira sp.]|nr:hypothetical protein [Nitrospira sp.]